MSINLEVALEKHSLVLSFHLNKEYEGCINT
jgi:hypothetical protein